MSDNDRLLAIADAILDGRPVGWDVLTSRAPEGTGPAVEDLQLLADIADAHRSLDIFVATRELRPIEKVGSGTFGDVYRAVDTALDREVALKLIRRPGTRSVTTEGRLLARVRHPNVVTVFGAAEHDGVYGIWMEFVRGKDLAAIVSERGPLPPLEAAEIAIPLCRGLMALHAMGLVHGDIKAQNVMREPGGRVVLMDFGTSRFAAESDQPVGGTPLYVAPEVLRGSMPSVSADVYAVGVLLYFLLTAAFPVDATSAEDVRAAHASGKWRAIRDRAREIPASLARIVERAIDPDPRTRYESAAHLEADLVQWTAHVHRPNRNAIRAAVAAGVVLALLAVGLWWHSQRAPDLDGHATTTSGAALHAYREGAASLRNGNAGAAETAFREAVRLDPSFASALIMVVWAQRNQGKPFTAESASLTDRAVALSTALPSEERGFIAGSAAFLRGRIPEALTSLETVVKEAPNHYWAILALDWLYAKNGRLSGMSVLETRLADLQRNDFLRQCQTAEYFVTVQGNVRAAEPFVDRAAALAAQSAPTRDRERDALGFVRVFPAFVAWASGRAHDAAARLDRLSTDLQVDDALASAIGLLDLSMGRLHAADVTFGRMTPGSDRLELMALVALARADSGAARASFLADPSLFDWHVRTSRGVIGRSPVVVWGMAHAGLRDAAESSVAQRVIADPAGILATLRGDPTGLVKMEGTSRTTPVGKELALVAIDTLASAAIDAGRFPEAQAILNRVGAAQTTLSLEGATGFLWLQLRAKLLQVERELGHTTQAAALEREVMPLLEEADADFTPRQVIRRHP